MLPAAVGRSGDKAFRELGYAYVRFAKKHPGLYEATARFPEPDDIDLQQSQQSVVQIVVQALREYQLDEDLLIHIVRGLRSILHGFSSIEQMGGFRLAVDTNQSFEIIINTFIEGIHAVARKNTNL
ncbi:MAG TPA: TetR-like C-terminal domain-containing protein [Bacillaceae bacterium]